MDETTYTAFSDLSTLASGPLHQVLEAAKAHVDGGSSAALLIFSDDSGRQIDFDLRGSLAEVLDRALPSTSTKRPGRPKLGVVAREVTLLPRHWEWLEQQPNGSSAALRRLVDEARKREPSIEKERRMRDALSNVLWAIAGNLAGFEEATRALFAKRDDDLLLLISDWPEGVRRYVRERIRLIAELGSKPSAG